MVMKLHGFSAWITVDGAELNQYNVEVSPEGNKATCWIPSQVGKASKPARASPSTLSSSYAKTWIEIYLELERFKSNTPACWLRLCRWNLLRRKYDTARFSRSADHCAEVISPSVRNVWKAFHFLPSRTDRYVYMFRCGSSWILPTLPTLKNILRWRLGSGPQWSHEQSWRDFHWGLESGSSGNYTCTWNLLSGGTESPREVQKGSRTPCWVSSCCAQAACTIVNGLCRLGNEVFAPQTQFSKAVKLDSVPLAIFVFKYRSLGLSLRILP
jgi:hypothetical protein